jgi:uncharacterized membrane protein YgcG
MRRYVISLALAGLASAASAQTQVGPGWSAFAGCWSPIAADGSRNVAANTPHVCVVPNGASADLITLVGDSLGERTRVDADGREHEVNKQGCNGWEKAEFSSDGRRLYLRSEQTCAGGLKRATSGIFAITPSGDWVNATNVSADSTNSVRVTRYAARATLATMPAEIRDALAARELSDRTARVAAQREVSIPSVIEASRFVAAPAEEAWVAELDQDFNLDDRTLVQLADAKVPSSVIDMMVAVSNPSLFSVRPTGIARSESDSMAMRRDRDRDRYPYCFAPVMDPWAWYAYDPCDPYLRYSPYRSRWYYDNYYGYGYGYYGNPVIIVRGSGGVAAPTGHGKMTKDGYKRDPSSTSSSGSASSGATTSKGSDSRGSDSRGSDSKGSSSSGGGSSSGRTATRKPPAN